MCLTDLTSLTFVYFGRHRQGSILSATQMESFHMVSWKFFTIPRGMQTFCMQAKRDHLFSWFVVSQPFKLVGLVIPSFHNERIRSKVSNGASSLKIEPIDETSLLYDSHEQFLCEVQAR